MSPLKLRAICLKEAAKLEHSADRIMQLAFAFECYAALGFDAGIRALASQAAENEAASGHPPTAPGDESPTLARVIH